MDEHGMPEREPKDRGREIADRMIESSIEALVEAEDDITNAQRVLEHFLVSTPPPTQPSKFDNLRALLDYSWQVVTYNKALEEWHDALTRAVEERELGARTLSHIFPMEVPLRYTYRGERDRLHNQPYIIFKTPEGVEVQKQIPTESE
jgi:hypothetical protein